MKTQTLLRFPAAVAVLLSALTASAATWTGTTSGDWQVGTNWGGTAPIAAESAIFAGTTNTTITNAPTITLGTAGAGGLASLSFTNTTAGQSFNISGGPITVGGNVSTTAVVGGGTISDVVQSNLVLNGNRTFTIAGNHNLTVSGVISGTNATRVLTKNGNATLTLSGANTYTGGTTITAGTLALGASGVLADAGAVTMNSGTLALGGFTETMGVLNLSASSIIDLGAGGKAIFADSIAGVWAAGAELTIAGTFASDSIQFAGTGLTSTQLSQIRINGVLGATLVNGFLSSASAVPEPSTYAALAGLAILGFAASRRRRAA